MRLLGVVFFACTVAIGFAQSSMHKYQLVFLMLPVGAPQIAESQKQEFMQAHNYFLQGLWKSGKSRAIGPLMDAGRLGEIVILEEKDRDAAAKLLADEPGIKRGLFEANILEFWTEAKAFGHADKFTDLEPMWFGFLDIAPNAPKIDAKTSTSLMDGHLGNFQRMADKGQLLLAGPIAGGRKIRGLIFFRGIPKSTILEEMKQDPFVQRGVFRVNLMKWTVSKGSFRGLETKKP